MHTPRRTVGRDRSVGFSLIELLVVLAISSTVGASILGAVVWQSRLAIAQQESADAHQRARTIINFIQSAGRQTGFGFPRDPNMAGYSPLGTCTTTADPTFPSATGYPLSNNVYAGAAYQYNCTGLDQAGVSDRLRMIYLDPWLFYYSGQTSNSSLSCSSGADGTYTAPSGPTQAVNLSQGLFLSPYVNPSSLPSAAASLGFIGGSCAATEAAYLADNTLTFKSFATPTLWNGGNLGSSGSCSATYKGQSIFQSGLGCNAYAAGYMMGTGEILDVYTALDPTTGIPGLFVRQFGWGPTNSLLSQYVSAFQVRYGFNTTSYLDGQINACASCTDDPFSAALGSTYAWCRDPRAADIGGTCVLSDENGNTLSSASLRNRMVALYVTFSLRSRTLYGAKVAPAVDGNGYGLWTYRTLVSLRAMREHS